MKKQGRFGGFLGFVLICVLTGIGIAGCTTLMTPASNVTDIKSVDFSKQMKEGESCSYYIFGLIGPFGDSSIVKASKDSGMSRVALIDYKYGWYLVTTQRCVKVYGE